MDLKRKIDKLISDAKKKEQQKVQTHNKEIKKLVTVRDKKRSQMIKAQKSIVKKQQEFKRTRGR